VSVENPLLYYENNVSAFLCTAGIAENDGGKLYFSSSCTVYGQAEKMPITEDASIQKRCLLMEIPSKLKKS
jgi:UDP-glucose 4-epimerase